MRGGGKKRGRNSKKPKQGRKKRKDRERLTGRKIHGILKKE
ncbi:hypothetical protein [Ructibacterium gallinarum]|nr:hypothetical protein [Ructibacterium gallinarum]